MTVVEVTMHFYHLPSVQSYCLNKSLFIAGVFLFTPGPDSVLVSDKSYQLFWQSVKDLLHVIKLFIWIHTFTSVIRQSLKESKCFFHSCSCFFSTCVVVIQLARDWKYFKKKNKELLPVFNWWWPRLSGNKHFKKSVKQNVEPQLDVCCIFFFLFQDLVPFWTSRLLCNQYVENLHMPFVTFSSVG